MPDTGVAALSAQLLTIRAAAAATAVSGDKSRPVDRISYVAAVQSLESVVQAMGDDDWRAAAAAGTLTDTFSLAADAAEDASLPWPASCAWQRAADALFRHRDAATAAAVAARAAPRLWEGLRHSVFAMGVLRAVLPHCPATPSGGPRQLPHPQRTASVALRVAALRLLPALTTAAGAPSRAPWADYIRRAAESPEPGVRVAAVSAASALLEGGRAKLEEPIAVALLDAMLCTAEAYVRAPAALRNGVGVAVGRLLASVPIHSLESTRLLERMLQPTTVTRSTQQLLAVALGELLLLRGGSPEVLDWLFALLHPVRGDNRAYMPLIISRAVVRWALLAGSDLRRCVIANQLVRQLSVSADAAVAKSAAHAALVGLAAVISSTVAVGDFGPSLWAELLRLPTRHPSLGGAVAEVLAQLAQRNDVCGRTLCRTLYTLSFEIDADMPPPPACALLVRTLLATGRTPYARQAAVMETLLALVAALSTDAPPPRVEVAFLRRVELFNRLARLLLLRHRSCLAPVTVANIRTSARVFLGVVVSNPLATSIYTRAATSACDLLRVLHPEDMDLKLVIALLETLFGRGGARIQAEANDAAVAHLKAAAYKLLSTPAAWAECTDYIGKRSVAALALEDVLVAIRDNIPCIDDKETFEMVSGDTNDKDELGEEDAGEDIDDTVDDVDDEFVEEDGSFGSDDASMPGERALLRLLGDVWRLSPVSSQYPAAVAARRAIRLIATASAAEIRPAMDRSEDDGAFCRRALERLRDAYAPGAMQCALWTLFRAVDAIASAMGTESSAIEAFADAWIAIAAAEWRQSPLFAVRLAAARAAARVIAAAGGGAGAGAGAGVHNNSAGSSGSSSSSSSGGGGCRADRFTAGAVAGGCSSGSAAPDEGLLLALGELHACGNRPTAAMAVSFIARTLRNSRPPKGTAAFFALARLAPRNTSLVRAAIDGLITPLVVLPELSEPQGPLAAPLRLALTLRLRLHMQQRDESPLSVAVWESMHGALEHGNLDVAPAPVALVRAVAIAARGVGVDAAILQRQALVLLDGGRCTDAISRAVAVLLSVCWTRVEAGSQCPLLIAAAMIDAAAAPKTRETWLAAARVAMKQMPPDVCLRDLAAIMRAKPRHGTIDDDGMGFTMTTNSNNSSVSHVKTNHNNAHPDEGEEERGLASHISSVGGKNSNSHNNNNNSGSSSYLTSAHSITGGVIGTFGSGGGGGGGKKSGNGGIDEDVKREFAGEVGSKFAAFILLEEMLRRPDLFRNKDDDSESDSIVMSNSMDSTGKNNKKNSSGSSLGNNNDKSAPLLDALLRVLFASVSLAEVMPSLVHPAADALRAVAERCGNRVVPLTGASFLLPWKVQLVNETRAVIQRSVFCWSAACALAESLVASNVADDSLVRRVVGALAVLLARLEECDAESDAAPIAHGGAGRVFLALIACERRARLAGWPSAAAAAAEVMASPCGQSAAAQLCDRHTAAAAMARGYGPTHEMSAAPLDDCAHGTPAAALAALDGLGGAGRLLGPTARHAAGVAAALLLAAPPLPLRPIARIAPFLAAPHQAVLAHTSLQRLPAARDAEERNELLRIAAATITHDGAERVEAVLMGLEAPAPPSALRLAMAANVSLHALQALLCRTQVAALVAAGEPTDATAAYIRRLDKAQRHALEANSPCGFLLTRLSSSGGGNNSSSGNSEGEVDESVSLCSRRGLALFAAVLSTCDSPLPLLQRLAPQLHRSRNACGALLALCCAVKQQSGGWTACAEYALLATVHPESMQHEANSRMTLFVRGLLLLQNGATAVETRTLYPKAVTALIQRLARQHTSELRAAIQSLEQKEATALRELMQTTNTAPSVNSGSSTTAATTNRKPTQRLNIDIASYQL